MVIGRSIHLMPRAGAKLAATPPKTSIGNRAAKDQTKKDPENKHRKGKVSSEANP